MHFPTFPTLCGTIRLLKQVSRHRGSAQTRRSTDEVVEKVKHTSRLVELRIMYFLVMILYTWARLRNHYLKVFLGAAAVVAVLTPGEGGVDQLPLQLPCDRGGFAPPPAAAVVESLPPPAAVQHRDV